MTRKELIKLANEKPELRKKLVPLIKEAGSEIDDIINFSFVVNKAVFFSKKQDEEQLTNFMSYLDELIMRYPRLKGIPKPNYELNNLVDNLKTRRNKLTQALKIIKMEMGAVEEVLDSLSKEFKEVQDKVLLD